MSKKRKGIVEVLVWIVVVIAVLWVISPFYWAVITSFKKPADVFRLSGIPWVQFQPTLNNWRTEFDQRGPEIARGILNSITIAVCASILAVFLGSLAGYGLARYRYTKWRNQSLSFWFLSQRFLPPAATVIPFFLLMKSLKLLDTQLALILVNTTFVMPFAVLIMKDMFRELPVELEEAAWVDGCSRWQSFVRIALPLAAPALVATVIICFAFAWNEFLFALVLTYKKASPMTVVIAGTEHTQGVQFWYVSTRLLLAIIPPTILALTVQKYIVRGLTMGAVKG
ncbi:MAG: carbohydrate ABC transporter permease [Candidatus Caldatribacteriaceae bacterium]